jgi:Glycine-zipper domain
MLVKWSAVPIALVALLSGCASIPTGPSVMVLPGNGKTFEQFQTDDAVCRQWSAGQMGTTTQDVGTQSTVSGAVIGTVVGAAAGAALGAAAGNAGLGAAAGAGAGLLGGTAIGAGRGGASQGEVQHRYDMTYMQCMYTKGNQIPVARGSQSSTYTTAPPAPAAPSAPPALPPPPGPPPPPPPPR